MADANEVGVFGARLLALRKAAGLTQADVADALKALGFKYKAQSVGAWERGEYPPGGRNVVFALEQVLDAEGELAPILGYAEAPAGWVTSEQFEEVVRRLEQLEREIRERPARDGRRRQLDE